MLIPSSYDSTPRYADFKKQTFDKYERKVMAIILNIDQSSLKEGDRIALRKMLSGMLKVD
jgi:hypothetical protein